MKTTKYIVTIALALVCAWGNSFAVDQSYYSSVDGKSGKTLFDAVHTVAKTGYKSVSYDGLWTIYCVIDLNLSGKVWDMYSNATSYTCGSSAQGANYKKEGDSYNREHSIPKNWFGGSESSNTPGTDLFHVVPTDGYVNNQRSAYAYGEVSSANYTSQSGCKKGSPKSITISNSILNKTGSSSQSCSASTVFEPMDEFKGDFARGYLGAMIKWANGDYQTFTTAEGAQIFNTSYDATHYYGLKPYGVALLLKWHREDPVSQKEIDRNNGIQTKQGNRNPFIDYPELVEYIWGEHNGETVNLSSLTPTFEGYTPPEATTYTVILSRNGVTEAVSGLTGTYNLPASSDAACEGWTFAGWSTTKVTNTTSTPSYITSVTSGGTVYAVYSKTTPSGAPIRKTAVPTKASSIAVGDEVILVYESGNTKKEMTGFSTTSTVYGTVDDYSSTPAGTYTFEVVEGSSTGTFGLKHGSVYANWSSGNSLSSSSTLNANSSWSISFSSGNAIIANANTSDRTIRYNTSNPRFACYTSGQGDVQLYKISGGGGGGGSTTYDSEPEECQCSGKLGTPVVTATPSDQTITLTWPDVANATNGYTVTISKGVGYTTECGETEIGEITHSGITNTCIITGLVNNLTYTTSVVANATATICESPADEDAATPVGCESWDITFGYSNYSLTAGGAKSAAPTITGTTYGSVTYHSSDEAIITVEEDGKVTSVSAGTATITAHWTGDATHCPKDVTSGEFTVTGLVRITFNANDGSETPARTTQDVTYNVETALTAINIIGFSRTGYTFQGWSTDKNATSATYTDGSNITITAATTLYAVWQVNKHNVTFDQPANGGTYTVNSSSSSPMNNVNFGSTVTIAITPTNSHFTVGTVSVSGASGAVAVSGEGNSRTFTMPDEDVTVSVTMTEETKYTVNWYVASTPTAEQNYAGEALAGIADPEIECNGKTFQGWTATANYSSDDTAPNDLFNDASTKTMPSNNTTNYYAVFATETTSGSGSGNLIAFDGTSGKSGLIGIDGVTHNGLGSDYTSHSPYLLRFDNSGDYIQFELSSIPTSLSFGYKMIGGNSSSTMTIKECATANGTYTDVEAFTISGAQNSTGTKTTSNSFSQKNIRMVFTKGSNVGVGAITIVGNGTTTTISDYTTSCTAPTEVTVTFHANYEGADPATATQTIPYNTEAALTGNSFSRTGYTFLGWAITPNGEKAYDNQQSVTLTSNLNLFAVWQANNHSVTFDQPESGGTYTVNSSSSSPVNNVNFGSTVTIAITPTNSHFTVGTVIVSGASGAVAVSGEGNSRTFIMPDEDVTVSVTLNEDTKYTVTWYVAGNTTTETNYVGEALVGIADPTSGDCDGSKVFVGWTSHADYEDETDEPDDLFTDLTGKVIPVGGTTYYAVFADEDGSGSGSGGNLVEYDGSGIMELEAIDGVSQNGVSTYSTAPYLLKFDDTGDYIQFALDAIPTSLSFDYKMVGGANTSTMTIKECATANGTYTDVEAFTISGAQNSTGTKTTSNSFSQKYIRMVFTKGSNVGVGAITIAGAGTSYSNYATSCTPCDNKVTLTKGEETNGTFTLNKANGEYNNCTSNFVVSVSNITPADHYHCTGVTATGGNSEVSGPDGSGNYTVSYNKGNNITSTITANFAPNPTNAIRFFNNGVQVGETQNLYEGQVATKPSPDPTACEGYTFVGWWTAALATDNTTAETWVTDFTVSGAQDYYAVYSKTETSGGGGSPTPATLEASYSSHEGWTISGTGTGGTGSSSYWILKEGATITSPAISDLSTVTSITFKARTYGGSSYNTVDVSTSGSVAIGSASASSTSLVNKSISVSGLTGSGSIVFSSSTTSSANGPGIDNIVINYSTSGGSSTTYYTTAPACCSEVVAPTVNVTAKSTSAIISWNNQANAVNGYSVTVKEGNSVVYENNFAAGVTSCNVTGLSSSTEYNYTVVAKGETCNSSASGNFTTTACDDAPVLGVVTVTATTATLDWTCSAATATIKLYSDAECNNQEGSDYTSATSPYTIEHLTSETTYYFKVFTGSNCSSNVGSFTTEKLDLDVAEWQPDAVVISYNGDGELTLTTYTEETHGDPHANVADDIFFSKYYEAARNVKLLAVFNGTLADVNLSDYKLGLAQSSGADKAFTFTKFSDFKKGDGKKLTADELKLKPNEELILISYKDEDSMDQQIISCAQADESTSKFSSYVRLSTPELQFNGDDAIALLDADGKMIDLIGAGTKDGGSVHAGASFQTCSSSAGTFNGFMDTPGGWYTPNGYQANQDNTETFPYGLSSNRCLLIRRKHVKSGYNAVLHNKEDFLTLGNYEYEDTDYEGEWKGVQIPGSTSTRDGLTNSCTGFDDVGSYNYNEYYIEFEQDLVEQTFENYKSDPFDGTYVIPVTGLSDLACSNIRIELKDGEGNLILGKNIKVPIMVTTAITTTDDIFHSNYKDADICRSCDLVIFDNAQLTKVTDGTANDVDAVRDVKVYPGGKLIVPGGTNYSVNSISFRREEDDVATADIRGNLNIRETGDYVFFDMLVDPTNWHYFSLPYDCNVNDITLSTGEPATLGTDYLIKWYDGGKRAATQSGGCWETVAADATLKKGIGYIFSIPGTGIVKREFRFPMSNEIITEEKDPEGKIASGVYAYGGDKSMTEVRANHRGWNLLGNPYLMPYSSDITDPLMTGYIVPDYPTDPEEIWDGHFKFDETSRTNNLRYIVEPINNGWSGYTQVTIASYEMKPFTSYFVQIEGDDPEDPQGVQFNLSAVNRSASPVRRAPAEYEEVEDRHPVWCAVTLTNPKGEKDETTLLISDNFTDGYDMMDDLTKWRGTYYQYAQITTAPVLASRNNEGEMAFNALPDSSALAGVPLNYFAASQGFYTIAYDDKYDRDMEVKEVKLWDKTTNQWYNLMYEPYSFSTARTDNKDRFVLSVRVERKQNQTTTDLENVGTYKGDKPRKLLINGLLYIQRGKDVYDVTGKQLLNR